MSKIFYATFILLAGCDSGECPGSLPNGLWWTDGDTCVADYSCDGAEPYRIWCKCDSHDGGDCLCTCTTGGFPLAKGYAGIFNSEAKKDMVRACMHLQAAVMHQCAMDGEPTWVIH